MAAPVFEMDPTFKRALRLLHSTDKESTLELKRILDDALRERQGVTGASPVTPVTQAVTPSPSVAAPSSALSPSVTSKPLKTTPRRSPSPVEWQKAAGALMKDLVCIKCGSLDVGPSNRLVECSSCQSLHHQDCHIPKIPDSVAADTSSNWKCSSCSGGSSRSSSTVALSSSGSRTHHSTLNTGDRTPSSRGSSPGSTGTSSSPPKPRFNTVPYNKRPYSGSGGSSGSSSSSLSKSSLSSSSHSKGSSSKSSIPSSAPSLKSASAEKRMQLMKKKAARKMEHKKM